MAQVQRHRRAIAAALLGLVALAFAPALAEDREPNAGTDLYDRPVLAIDPGMHTARIWSQAVDAAGRFAVTGGDDGTVRIWSVADGKLVRANWVPVGPENVGALYAVAISPDGSTIAAGGFTETRKSEHPIYIFDRESGNLVRRIHGDLPDVTYTLTFSPDGRYLAATLGGGAGLRVFDRDKDWREAFRDDQYGDGSLGAAFTRDGRLATAADDGFLRLYRYDLGSDSPNFRRVGNPARGQTGKDPVRVAFSPDGKRLAVGYYDVAAVDVLDGATFARVGGHSPTDAEPEPVGLEKVAWSTDGQTLYAAGAVIDAKGRRLLFAWDRGGLGDERRMTYCGSTTASEVNALPEGRILVASMMPCLGLMDDHGKPIWTIAAPVLDFRRQVDQMRVSADGRVVEFGYGAPGTAVLRFDVRSLTLSNRPSGDGLMFAPNQEGLTIDGWWGGTGPTLNGRALPFNPYERARSLAIAPDAKRFFLDSSYALTAFDDAGTKKWRWRSRNEVWAVNATRDGRVVVSASSDGVVRWHRAVDGSELLALQVLPNKGEPAKWDWVLWTPEGFYEATPGAEDVLKWVVNHGPDKAASTLPVSAIAKLHRPDALKRVLDQLETERALGVADIAAARLDVQQATGSAKPPGGVLQVLAIGVDQFGDKAGGLKLEYAVDDARDFANTVLESQQIGPGKASLYGGVSLQYLHDEGAGRTAILEAMDKMAQIMGRGGPDQDLAVILFSAHGEMIEGQFYLIPYGFDVGTPTAMETSAVSADEFARKVKTLAAKGRVLLLLDACHSGAVGPGGSAADASVLRAALTLDNVTVLTSSRRDELSQELPAWKHGAFTQAFLDALAGGADPEGRGVISVPDLVKAMDQDLDHLTKGQQHLGPRVNFLGDVFVASH